MEEMSLIERVVTAIENLTSAIVRAINNDIAPEKEQPASGTVPPPEKDQTGSGSSEPDTEKEELTKKLEAAGVTVGPRKRIETLRTMWAEVEAAGGNEDLFGGEGGGDLAPTYTAAQVKASLTAYISQDDDKEKQKERRIAIKAKLKELEAQDVSALAEEHYGTLIEAFKVE